MRGYPFLILLVACGGAGQGTLQLGAVCTMTSQCVPGLVCTVGTCASNGTGSNTGPTGPTSPTNVEPPPPPPPPPATEYGIASDSPMLDLSSGGSGTAAITLA